MNERMFQELDAHLSMVQGDVIDFRVYKGSSFAYLVKLAQMHKRHAVGLDTFYGLETPTNADYNQHNQLNYPRGYGRSNPDIVHENIKRVCGPDAIYTLLGGRLEDALPKVPTQRKYAIAIIDMLQYVPTKTVLAFISDKMTDGGLLYFLNYDQNANSMSSRAVDEFITEQSSRCFILPSIIVNENVMPIKRVTMNKAKPVRNTRSKSNSNKKNVALVLRTGGDTYDYRYVNALAANIKKKTTTKINLVVLTDDPTGIDRKLVNEIIPLKHNFPGWWSKIELFRPGIFTGQVLFFDLDTVIVDNIDDLLNNKTPFSGIRDLFHYNIMQTGIMSWDSSLHHEIYTNFVANSRTIMAQNRSGDAKWIRETLSNYDYLQDDYPNKIVSYKAHCFDKTTGEISIPKGASVICFHGKPRPHTIEHPEIVKHWKYAKDS